MNRNVLRPIGLCIGLAISFSLASCADTQETGGGETTSLVWYYPGTQQVDHKTVFDSVNQILAEKHNITIEPRVIDTGSYQEKMNMVIASNENYDLCFTSNWTNRYLPNVQKKAYMPLNSLIDTNAPALRSALPDFAWEISRFGDDIYAVPNYQMIFYQPTLCVPTALYNKYSDLLKGISEPRDLEPYLQAIKENEPTLYPFQVMDAAMWLKYEGVYGSEVCVIKDTEKPTAINPYDNEEYKNYIMLMSDWFDKGYIRKDIASVTDDASDIKNMKYAVWYTQYKPGREYFDVQGQKIDVTFIQLDEPYLSNGAGTQAMTAISSNSKKAEQAVKLLEVLNTDTEVYNLICYGIEGTHYERINDSVIQVLDDSKYSPKTDWEFGNQFNAFITEDKDVNVWAETDAINRESNQSKLFGFVFNSQDVKTEIANISSVVSEYKYLEKGTENAQENLNEFINKLQASGIEKVVDETQRQIDEWLKK